MTALTLTRNNISANEERGAILEHFIANEAMSVGDAVYLDSNNKANKAKADTAAHALTVGMVVNSNNFAGETNILAGDWVTICSSGPVQGFSGLVNGQLLYIDKTTAGAINDTAPTGAYQYVIGQAQGADTIFIRPGQGSTVSA